MAILTPWVITEQFDWQAFRDDSRQLEEFRTRDFSSMAAELANVIKHGKPEQRFIPLAWRVCRDLAIQYVRRPTRVFEGVGLATADALADIYKRAKFDQFMLRMHQRLIGHTSQIISADPIGPRQVKLRAWAPFEADVCFKDALEDDIRRAERVELLVPIRRLDSTLHYGRRVYTQTDAWTEATGNKVSLFNEDEKDLSHDFGEIPLRAIRRDEAIKGWYFPPLPLDLLSVQIGLNIAVSDIELICRHQCYGREALTGPGALVAAEQMQDGPDFMRIYPVDAQYSYTETNPAVDKYLNAVESTLPLFGSNNYISPESRVYSTGSRFPGVTGNAKEVERIDQREERERSEVLLEDAEQDIAELITNVLARNGDSLLAINSEAVQVKIKYNYVEPMANNLQTSQARELDYSQGLGSPEEDVARIMGIPASEAKGFVEERLESFIRRRSQLGAGAADVPGLDRIGAATGA